MAIVVEEERRNESGILTILIWLVILGVIVAAVYYIFFKQPEKLTEIAAPPNFKTINELAKVKLTPEDIINNPDFVALKPYITLPPPQKLGRANPFLPI